MMVYQVLVTLVHGDAIGNHACHIDAILRELGYKTQIYAENRGPGSPQDRALPVDQMPTPQNDDIVIYHMCETTRINQMLTQWNSRKIAIYHNVTPPEFFRGFSPEQEMRQYKSLEEIARMSDCFDHIIADSEFNRRDLIRMGYDGEKISVLPVIMSFEDYSQVPDAKTVAEYSDGRTNVLFVGRIAPNKKYEDIIRTFAYYKKTYDPTARLLLVGSPFNERYIRFLEEYIGEIGVEDVIFFGHVPFSAILAAYSCADVLLCLSEHEGFCVPLLEAMLFKVPIVAYSSAAIPGTLGGSGLLCETKDPVFIAALIDRVREDKELRDAVISKQSERLKDFAPEVLIKRFSEKLREIVCEGLP